MTLRPQLALLAALLLLAPARLSAQVAPKYSNEFLNIGVGARNLAMAGSTSSSTRGVESAFWNPAALAGAPARWEIGAMHAEYFAGISKYDYLGAAYALPDSARLAFSAVRLGIDGIQNTLEVFDSQGNIDYNRIELFSVADYAFVFSYARPSPLPGLSIGANAKVVYRDVGKFAQAFGFGLDAAARWAKGRWAAGIMAQDITGTFNAWSFDQEALNPLADTLLNPIPDNALEVSLPQVRLAGSGRFQINPDMGLLAELALHATFDGQRADLLTTSWASFAPALGLELDFRGIVMARAGVGNFQNRVDFDGSQWTSFQPNIGLGLKIKNLRIDYALTDIGSQVVSYSNIFSLAYAFR